MFLNRGLLFAAAMSGIGLLAAGCGPTYPKCENDDHCSDKGEYCLNGMCQQCRDSSHCDEGFVCNAGQCARPEGYCDDSTPCPGNQKCRDNRCGAECMDNSECGAGQICKMNACVAKPECGPNDVLVEGRKVSGILLESSSRDGHRMDWLVVGIGVNLAHHPAETEFPATDLAREGAEGLTPARLLESLCARFSANMVLWRNMGFAAIRRNWMRRAHGLGQPLTVRLDRHTFDGVFEDLDGDGALMLRMGADLRKFTAGDVFFPHLAPGH